MVTKTLNDRAFYAPAPLQTASNSTLNYLAVSNRLPGIGEVALCPEGAEKCLCPGHRVVIQIILAYSMRSAELLRLTMRDMLKPTVFLVKGAKRSYAYTIMIPFSDDEMKALVKIGIDEPIFPFTYHQIWRGMKRAGMSVSVKGRINDIVTHRGRYDLADKMQELNLVSDIQGCLRHKSGKSKDYYLLSKSKPMNAIDKFKQSSDCILHYKEQGRLEL